jgi:membrane dipeptidase
MNAKLSLFLLTAAGNVMAATSPAQDLSARAARLHQAAIVVDTHEDVPEALEEKWGAYANWHDLGEAGATKHVDIPRARQGGLTAPFFAVYVPARYAETGGAARYALELSDMVDGIVARHPADLVAAASVEEIRRAKRDGRMAVLKGIEGGHAIEDSMGALRDFYRLGVRYMTLTHTNTNHWADSAGNFFAPDYDPATYQVHHGLSDFGRAVVREMNRLGMMVDVSHVSSETVDDVLEASRAPVFASHSSCRALSDMPRNLTDEQIKRIAAKGGVVMINVSSTFLDQANVDAVKAAMARIRPEYLRLKEQYKDDPKRRQEEQDKLLKSIPERKPTDWTKAVDHIEHVIRLAGPDAVGLGTDFDGIPDPPAGLEDVSKLPRITEELLRRGHSEDEVRKVLGESFLRFFSKVEEVSRSLSAEPPSLAAIPPTP